MSGGIKTPLAAINTAARGAVPWQMGWALLAALWNVAGVVLQLCGRQALGPTASALAAAILVAFAIALPWVRSRLRWLYGALSAVAALLAIRSVINAFTADPALWPSEFWRLGDAALNTVGAVACLVGLLAAFKSRRGNP